MSRFNLSAFGVQQRAITLFLIITVSVAGIFAFFRLGRAEDPSFVVKVMTIAAAWPGATARSLRSCPAQKPRPAPVSTITRASVDW